MESSQVEYFKLYLTMCSVANFHTGSSQGSSHILIHIWLNVVHAWLLLLSRFVWVPARLNWSSSQVTLVHKFTQDHSCGKSCIKNMINATNVVKYVCTHSECVFLHIWIGLEILVVKINQNLAILWILNLKVRLNAYFQFLITVSLIEQNQWVQIWIWSAKKQ